MVRDWRRREPLAMMVGTTFRYRRYVNSQSNVTLETAQQNLADASSVLEGGAYGNQEHHHDYS